MWGAPYNTRMVRVKICGITTPQDAGIARDAGADVIGLNLFTGPRRITLDVAAAIARSLNGAIELAALIEYRQGRPTITGDELHRIASLGVTVLQVYGSMTHDEVATLHERGFAVWLPVQVAGMEFVDRVATWQSTPSPHRPDAILLDTSHASKSGGTGQTFDWSVIEQARAEGRLDEAPRIIVAGGLTANNVSQAIRQVQPWMVDVAGGVESSQGQKSPEKIRAFMAAVRSASP